MEASIPSRVTIAILSDIHFAGVAERARGNDFELRSITNPLLRALVRFYRHFIWMRNPLEQGAQLDNFLSHVGSVDHVIANGDYSCDSGFVGVCDDAVFQSAEECLGKLRARFGERALFTIGDHEIGKLSLIGGNGGMRLASWSRATESLGLQPFWQLLIGNYVLMGVASPLICLARKSTGHLAGGMAGMVETTSGTSVGNPRRVRLLKAGAARDFILPRPHRPALFVA